MEGVLERLERWVEDGGSLEEAGSVDLSALLDSSPGDVIPTPAAAPDTAAALFDTPYQPSWAAVEAGGGGHARFQGLCRSVLKLLKEYEDAPHLVSPLRPSCAPLAPPY